jgi:predicted glycoside hydrolase/deacetylase ChbG (UPF0249 family)
VKKFILNADNFGKNSDYNRGVLNGYNNGFVTSASIVANGEAFDTAINEILPECQQLSVGVHLDITQGKPLTDANLLIDNTGGFSSTFLSLIKAVNNDALLREIEAEFRAQIEKVQTVCKITHIDSVEHIHVIPKLFNLVCKLADEYSIPYVRTYKEELYFVRGLKYLINPHFYINLLKFIVISHYDSLDKVILKSYPNLRTNNNIIGITYSKIFDKLTLEEGLKTLDDEDDILVECFIHPCSYLRNINDMYSSEFKLTQDKILEDTIRRLGYDIVSHID